MAMTPTDVMMRWQLQTNIPKELQNIQMAQTKMMGSMAKAESKFRQSTDQTALTFNSFADAAGTAKSGLMDLGAGVIKTSSNLGDLYDTALKAGSYLSNDFSRAARISAKYGKSSALAYQLFSKELGSINKILPKSIDFTDKMYGKTKKVVDIVESAEEKFKKLGHQLERNTSKTLTSVTNKWDGLVGSIAGAATTAAAFNVDEALYGVRKQIKLTAEETEKLRKISLGAVFESGFGQEKIIGELGIAIKNGLIPNTIEAEAKLKAMASASQLLELATGAAGASTVELFSRLEHIMDLSPDEILGLASAYGQLGRKSAVLIDDLVGLGDTLTETLQKVPKESQIAVLRSFSSISALTRDAFADPKEMVGFFETFMNFSQGMMQNTGQLVGIINDFEAQGIGGFDKAMKMLKSGQPDKVFGAMLESLAELDVEGDRGRFIFDKLTRGFGGSAGALLSVVKHVKENKGALEELNKQFIEGYKNTNLLTDAAEEQKKTLTKLYEAIQNAGSAVAADLGWPLQQLSVMILQPVAKALTSFMTWITELPEPLKILRSILAVVFGGWVVKSIVKLATKLVLLQTAVFGLNKATLAFPTAIGKATAWADSFAGAVGKSVNPTLKWTSSSLSAAAAATAQGGAVKGLTAIFSSYNNTLGKAVGPGTFLEIKGDPAAKAKSAVTTITNMFVGKRGLLGILSDFGKSFINVFGMLLTPMMAVAKAFLPMIGSLFKVMEIVPKVFGLLVTGAKLIIGLWPAVLGPIALIGAALLGLYAIVALGPEKVGKFVVDALNWLGEFLIKIPAYIEMGLSYLTEAIPRLIDKAITYVLTLPETLFSAGKDAGERMSSGFGDLFFAGMKKIGKGIIEIVLFSFIKLPLYVAKILTQVIAGAYRIIGSFVFTMGKMIWNSLSNAFSGGNLWESIKSAFKGIGKIIFEYFLEPVFSSMEIMLLQLKLKFREWADDAAAAWNTLISNPFRADNEAETLKQLKNAKEMQGLRDEIAKLQKKAALVTAEELKGQKGITAELEQQQQIRDADSKTIEDQLKYFNTTMQQIDLAKIGAFDTRTMSGPAARTIDVSNNDIAPGALSSFIQLAPEFKKATDKLPAQIGKTLREAYLSPIVAPALAPDVERALQSIAFPEDMVVDLDVMSALVENIESDRLWAAKIYDRTNQIFEELLNSPLVNEKTDGTSIRKSAFEIALQQITRERGFSHDSGLMQQIADKAEEVEAIRLKGIQDFNAKMQEITVLASEQVQRHAELAKVGGVKSIEQGVIQNKSAPKETSQDKKQRDIDSENQANAARALQQIFQLLSNALTQSAVIGPSTGMMNETPLDAMLMSFGRALGGNPGAKR